MLVHVLIDQRLNAFRINVVATNCFRLFCWQSNKELGIRVSAARDNRHPVIEIESWEAVGIKVCGARRVVVELNPDIVKRSIANGLGEKIAEKVTLRSGREVEVLGFWVAVTVGIIVVAQALRQVTVSYSHNERYSSQ